MIASIHTVVLVVERRFFAFLLRFAKKWAPFVLLAPNCSKVNPLWRYILNKNKNSAS